MDAYRSYQISAAAVSSANASSGEDISAVRVRLFEQRSRARWALASQGADSVPFALQMLVSFDPEERDDGRVILGLVGSDDETIDKVVSLMRCSEDPRTRQMLISLLGERRNGRAIPHLTALLMDPSTDQETKQAAMNALGLLTSPSSEPESETTSDVRVEMGDWIAEHRGVAGLDDSERDPEMSPRDYGSAAV